MMISIILFLSILLDGILSNYLPFIQHQLSYFTPLLTLVSIFCIYPLFEKKKLKYFITIFLVGIIYDLLFTNLIIWNGLLFLGIAYITTLIYLYLPNNFFYRLFYFIFIVCLYELGNIILYFIFFGTIISIFDYFYKVSHSVILNIFYGQLLYLFLYVLKRGVKHKF